MSIIDELRATKRAESIGRFVPNRALPGRPVDHVPQRRNHGDGLPPKAGRIDPHVNPLKPATMTPSRLILHVRKVGPDVLTFVFDGLPDAIHPNDGPLTMKVECARMTGHHYAKKHFKGVPLTVTS